MSEGLQVGPVALVPACAHHAFVLATTMREKDVQEVGICGFTPIDALLQSLRVSELAVAALYDDEVGALFGVESDGAVLGREDKLWFLTGHLFAEKPMAFFRAARHVVQLLLTRYPVLVNRIDARHDDALRFARAMGARFLPAEPYGPHGAPFIPFRIGGA